MTNYEYYLPSVEELIIDDPIDRIATIAHSCYQVDAKPHDSNVKFVKKLCGVKHMAMLDHGFMHFVFNYKDFLKLVTPSQGDLEIPWRYSKFMEFSVYDEKAYVTASIRTLTDAVDHILGVLYGENDSLDLIGTKLGQSYRFLIFTIVKFLPEEIKDIVLTHQPNYDEVVRYIDQVYAFINRNLLGDTEEVPYKIIGNKELRNLPISVRDSQEFRVYKLITDRGITHELVRHRMCAFAQESTRYCNYSREQFGDKIKIIKPLDYEKHSEVYDRFFEQASKAYFDLLAMKATPQEARHVLPNGLRAQITITANIKEWKHIFYQRLANDAHPEARRIIQLVKDDMIAKEII